MTTLTGNKADYNFSREGGELVIVRKSSGEVAYKSADSFTVKFADGSVDLSQSFASQATHSSSLFFGNPASTALTNGGYVLVWEHYGREDGDSQEGVTLQQYDAAGKLVQEARLVSGEAEDPTVAPTDDGGYIVAWSTESSTTSSVIIQHFNPDGTAKGSPQTVISSKTAELEDAVVGVLPNGNYVVSWVSAVEKAIKTSDPMLDMTDWEMDGKYEQETGDLYVQLYSATGNKIGAVQQINTSITDTVPDDQIILTLGNDGFLIAYTHETVDHTWVEYPYWPEGGYTSSEYRSAFYVREFNANGTPKDSEPKLLHSLVTDYPNATYYSLIKTDDGYLASWVANASADQQFGRTLIAQQFTTGFQPVGEPELVIPVGNPGVNDASLTSLVDGKYLVVWSTYNGGDENTTYAKLLSADLQPLADPFIVSEAGSFYEAEVTALQDGGFVIIWTSANEYGDDGSSLYSQRYDADGKPVGNALTVIEGSDADDELTWIGDSDVILRGGDGDDVLAGGSGNDILDGGLGNDAAVYSGNQSDYSFGHDGQGNLQVSSDNQRDSLLSIEQVQFTDGTISIDDGSVTLESDSQADSEIPATTTLLDGSQVVVWKQEGEVKIRLLKDGNWSELESGIEYGRGSLGVAPLGDGFVITWGEYEGDDLHIQRYGADGEPVGGEIVSPRVDADRNVDDISATQLSDGSFVLAWTEETPDLFVPYDEWGWDGEYIDGEGQAYIRLFGSDGSAKGDPVALAAGNLQAFEPSVSALQNGGFVVVWEYVNDKTESEEIYLQRFNADGTKDGKALQVNTKTNGDQGDPEVVTLADGSYVVTWTRETHDDIKHAPNWVEERTVDLNIFMQRFSADGKKLGGEAQVNATPGFYNDPSITALKDGGYVITWGTSDERDLYEGPSKLYVQVFDKNGVKVGGEQVVAGSSDQDYFPSVSASDDGGFLVVWEAAERTEDWDAGSGDIYARRFDANGNSLTLTGDAGDNALTWTDSSGVVLDGGAGDDVLTGGDGNDVLIGGSGNNTLTGGNGNDLYIIENTDDTIVELANGGIDTVRSSASYTLGEHLENLILAGADDIDGTGNSANNELTGNRGDNELDGGTGADILAGGDGDDTYIVDNLNDVVIEKAGEGIDTVRASVNWTLGANLENLELTGDANLNGTGNALDNELTGNSGKNTLSSGDGNDTLDGGAGVDKLIGGKGDDIYIVDLIQKGSGAKANVALEDSVTEAANAGDDTLHLRGELLTDNHSTLTLAANLETLNASQTGATKLNLTGNALDNTLIGNDADNILDGKAGIDTMVGGKGDDTYVLDRAEELDLVSEAEDEGNDTLRIAYNNTSKTQASTVDLSQSNLQHVENIELTGTGLFELIGNDADNVLDAGKNAATLKGGEGNDIYLVNHKDAKIGEEAGEGTDTVESTVTWALGENLENLTLVGKAALNATGNELNNVLTGNDGNNILDGGDGVDTLIGGKGNDTYIVRNVDDVVEENDKEGTDTVKAYIDYKLADHVENLILEGSDNIAGTGNTLNNTITGNQGHNILDGGDGVDKLIGGKGDDTYIVDLISKGKGQSATLALQDSVTEKAGEGDDDRLELRVENSALAQIKTDLALASKTTTVTLAATLEHLDASATGDIALNLTGHKNAKSLIGNAGDNILDAKGSAASLTGGQGDDTYVIYNESDLARVTEQQGEGSDTLQIAFKSTAAKGERTQIDLGVVHNVENINVTGAGLFELIGTDDDNRLSGNNSGTRMEGGLGNDTYVLNHKNDEVVEVEGVIGGNDTIETAKLSIDLTNYAYVENVTLTGKAALKATGNDQINTLTGNDGNNVLTSGANADDTIGFDTLRGGKGNDTYILNNANDKVEELANEGTDTVKTAFNYSLTANVENLILTGEDNINGTGNDLKNSITGNQGHNILDGGKGVDKLIGGKGNDTYIVDLIVKGKGKTASLALEDTITEKAKEGDDTLKLRISEEELAQVKEALKDTAKISTVTLASTLEHLDASQAGDIALNLTGNASNNIIVGNAGDNIIIGGAGADTMTGGAGADTFKFTSLKDLGLNEGKQDVILDFESGVDTLDFSALKGYALVDSNSFGNTAKQLRWEALKDDDGNDYVMVYGNTDKDADPEFSIKLVGISELAEDDFIGVF